MTPLTSDTKQRQALIVAANRGPVTFQTAGDGSRTFTRGTGGLVTALTGLAGRMPITWIACARTEDDLNWGQGNVTVEAGRKPATLGVSFLSPDADAYDGYYNIIANPLLWFLQHSMWDLPLAPVIDRKTWEAWTDGYVAVNQLFADAIAEQVRANAEPTMVMLQDYHLYLTPRMIRSQMRPAERPSLLHFVHIPWPGTEYWRILPPAMRLAILDGLCAVDLLGFQTHADSLNFMRTCQAYLPRASVKFGKGRVWYRNHATHVREFPISIDVKRLRQFAQSPQVADLRTDLETQLAGQKIILRIERTEPSKNIVRGFLAFEEMLETHPEH
ncbi:MAG: trehalose-6-phosphate synthase, partial [Anaerolineae bacterium]|nr:trehalose-6-phosphate synthase [Anaerolineae bacterium]